MLGKHGAIDGIIFQQRYATPTPLVGKHRDARGGEIIDIPVDGPRRHAEPFRKVPGGDGLFIQKNQGDFQKTVYFHKYRAFRPTIIHRK